MLPVLDWHSPSDRFRRAPLVFTTPYLRSRSNLTRRSEIFREGRDACGGGSRIDSGPGGTGVGVRDTRPVPV
ncbi:hypothetical protein FTUN_8488 [Frigoriglobus tundricola]|uniref:Uncharacterized protein n=1 Tax=Frigoriglobus tundricola TaxID=2774151 RepID=A0A6M5Z358_9BACT|nr:hypothetical protein FTUN_8488 [Frigoriglobus tundricola]